MTSNEDDYTQDHYEGERDDFVCQSCGATGAFAVDQEYLCEPCLMAAPEQPDDVEMDVTDFSNLDIEPI
jgi:hypothetical protein